MATKKPFRENARWALLHVHHWTRHHCYGGVQYYKEYSVLLRIFSSVEDIISTVKGKISALEGVQYCEEIFSSTIEDVQYCGGLYSVLQRDTMSIVGGNRKYCEGLPLTISTVGNTIGTMADIQYGGGKNRICGDNTFSWESHFT